MAWTKITQEWADGSITTMSAGGDLENMDTCIEAVSELWCICVGSEPPTDDQP